MFYQQELITKILSDKANNISKLAQKYTKLTRVGDLYIAKCPFHRGDTEDFIIDPKNNTWFCPVCGESGNGIAFIMKARDYSFESALKQLAANARISIPTVNVETVDNSIFYEINQAAARFFCENLKSSPVALEYFKKRKLSVETLIKFRLGYAPAGGSHLYNHLLKLGYKKDAIIKSGLVGISVRGEYYDKFRNRVMYPIADQNNRIIGFGGRVLDDSKPKYLNSPATPIFDKKMNLYGFNYAQNTSMSYFIFCEGYMDVIAMQQSGFDNAVASLGTALTKEQVNLISNYTDKVLLAYDSDGPGVSAALRAIEMLNEKGIECKIINMNPAKDPDEYIKTFGKESFMKRINEAENSAHFVIRKLKDKYKDENIVKYYEEATSVLLEKGAQ